MNFTLLIKNKLCLMLNEMLESRFNLIETNIMRLAYENRILANENIDLRLRLKMMENKKINVVFVCHRPAVWSSLQSVYDELKKDDRFDVRIVAIPNKKQLPEIGLNHDIYESEGAEEYWKEYGCINGYNYDTRKWYDLRALSPDYVFFQQPYNIQRCNLYKSWNVSKYAKICYVPYFYPYAYDFVFDECTPMDFFNDVSFYFALNDKDASKIYDRCNLDGHNICKIVKSGFPRFDNVLRYKEKSFDYWNDKDSFKIVWTPRWTTNENNCNFFLYKDKFVELCEEHGDIELIFRPHPQAFAEWESTGELTKDERNTYLKNFNNNTNMQLDYSKDYFPLLFSSDCLVSDRSSMIIDYLCTGKPVIYCYGVNSNEIDSIFFECCYVVKNWCELVQQIMSLKNGADALREKRRDFIYNRMEIGKDSASLRIVKTMVGDCSKE